MEHASHRVVVDIFGERHVLRGTQPEIHIRKLAEEVDLKMRGIARQTPLLGVHQVAILTALRMAEEKSQIHLDVQTLREENVALLEQSERWPETEKQLGQEISALQEKVRRWHQEWEEARAARDVLEEEIAVLRQDRMVWQREKEAMAEENALQSREKLRLKEELEELSSLLEAATAAQ